jgi:hypothetical protein
MLSSAAANEQSMENLGSPVLPSPIVCALQMGHVQANREIPGSARYGHDKRAQEKPGGSPPSGQEKPEMSGLVLLTPRNHQQDKNPSGDETYMENQSWNCAFI